MLHSCLCLGTAIVQSLLFVTVTVTFCYIAVYAMGRNSTITTFRYCYCYFLLHAPKNKGTELFCINDYVTKYTFCYLLLLFVTAINSFLLLLHASNNSYIFVTVTIHNFCYCYLILFVTVTACNVTGPQLYNCTGDSSLSDFGREERW